MRSPVLPVALAAALALAAAAPVAAGGDVTTIQVRERGAAVNFTNIPGFLTDDPVGTPPGSYFFMTVSAGVGEASGHNYPGSSKDTAWISYSEWDVDTNGEWTLVTDWAGTAADGAAGLTMTRNADTATLRTSMPVGYCAAYASEDEGGNCLDYVRLGTAEIDLEWDATTRLLTGTGTESWGSPGEWQYVSRHTGHYRDAKVSGSISLPGSAPVDVVSGPGMIYLTGIGSLDLYVAHGH